MKITKRSAMLPTLILSVTLLTSGIVYALTSADFSSKAATWAKANCTSSLASAKATTSNTQIAMSCYNYNKINEQALSLTGLQSLTNTQSSQISSISNSVSALQAHSSPLVQDSKGNILGTLISITEGNVQFYNSQIGLLVNLHENTPNNYSIYGSYTQSIFYTQPNCQGDWYVIYYSGDQYQMLLKPSPIVNNGSFLKLDKNTPLVVGSSILSAYIKDRSKGEGYFCDNVGQGEFPNNVNPIGYYAHILQVTNVPFSSNITGPLNLVQ